MEVNGQRDRWKLPTVHNGLFSVSETNVITLSHEALSALRGLGERKVNISWIQLCFLLNYFPQNTISYPLVSLNPKHITRFPTIK